MATYSLPEADSSFTPPDQSRAYCKIKGIPQSVFFYEDHYRMNSTDSERAIALAKGYCGICLEQSVCREYAIATNQEGGVWGGLTSTERKAVRGERYNKLVALQDAGILQETEVHVRRPVQCEIPGD